MENKNSKVLIIILTILVIGLSGFIVYDKVLEEETNIADNNNENTEEEQYTFSDFSGTVFQNNDGSGNNYLILWDNGTYSYEGSLGNYIVEGKIIKLNYIFENNQKVTEEKSIELTINSEIELFVNNEEITLIKVNHPTSPGGSDFYDAINN